MYNVRTAIEGGSGIAIVDGDQNIIEPATRFLTYLFARGCSPNTISSYAYDLIHLWRFLNVKGLSWDSLTPARGVELLVYLRSVPSKRKGADKMPRLITDHGKSLSARLSPATVNRIMVAVGSFYDWAILAGAFSRPNPINKVTDSVSSRVSEHYRPFLTGISRHRPKIRELRVKTIRRLPRPMNEPQIDRLMAELNTLRDKSLVLLMLNAGLRPGEALGLHLTDVAYGRRRVTVRCRDDHPKGARSKSRTERVVDIHDQITLSTLSSYVMSERPHDASAPFVFLIGGHGKNRLEPLSYSALVRLFARACERAQIREPWMTPHALRHTHATRMWEAGMRELTLQRRLGHASPDSTRIYTRVSDATVVAEYRQALGLGDSKSTSSTRGAKL